MAFSTNFIHRPKSKDIMIDNHEPVLRGMRELRDRERAVVDLIPEEEVPAEYIRTSGEMKRLKRERKANYTDEDQQVRARCWARLQWLEHRLDKKTG
jgi:hypothetical protein